MSTQPKQRTPKWSVQHKEQFRNLVKNRKINPQRSDTAYIDKIGKKYFPERPTATFRNNYKSSAAEYRVGEAINRAAAASAAARGEFFSG
jgi:hypothetical protein